MKFKDINNVFLNYHLVIVSEYETYKIIRHGSQENLKAYSEILKLLEENDNVTCEIDSQDIISRIESGRPYQFLYKFNAVLVFTLIYFILEFIYETYLVQFSLESQSLGVFLFILPFALLTLSIVLSMLTKSKHAPKLIIIGFIVRTLFYLFIHIFEAVSQPFFVFITVTTVIVEFVARLSLVVIVKRYFEISKTAKTIFKN